MPDKWLINLPKNSHSYFGRALMRMSIAVLHKNKENRWSLRELSRRLSIDKSTIYAWSRGEIKSSYKNKGKGLTEEKFHRLVCLLYGKLGGLETKDEILSWTRSMGDQFQDLFTRSSWKNFLETIDSKQPPPTLGGRLKNDPYFIHRIEIDNWIKDRIQNLEENQILILHGNKGIGLSTAIAQIEMDFQNKYRTIFPDGILVAYLDGGPFWLYLDKWSSDLGISMSIDELYKSNLLERLQLIKDCLKTKKMLLLIDDVALSEKSINNKYDVALSEKCINNKYAFSIIDRIIKLGNSESRVIISTHDNTVKNHFSDGNSNVFTINGFTQKNALDFYEKIIGKCDDVDTLYDVVKLLGGYPSELKIAFKQMKVNNETISKLSERLQAERE